jgi:hypothetical protein
MMAEPLYRLSHIKSVKNVLIMSKKIIIDFIH